MINIYINLHLLIAILNFAFCFLILRYSSRKLFHLFLAGIAFFSGIYALTIFLAYVTQNEFWGRLTYIGYFTPFFFVLFTLALKNTSNLKIKAFFYFLPLPFLIYFALFTDLIIFNINLKTFPPISSIGPLDFLARIYLILLLGIGIANLIGTYRKSQGIEKTQLKYFLMGVIIYIFVGVITVGVLPIIIPKEPIVGFITEFPSFASVLWVGLSSYAVLRYRLMDIRIFIGRGAVYFLTFISVLVPAYLFMYLNNRLFSPFPITLTWLFGLAIGISLFQPILKFYEEFCAKYFYSTFHNTQLILCNLGKRLIQMVNLNEVSSLIVSTLINTIKIDKISFAFKQPTNQFYQFQETIGFSDIDIASLINDTFLCSYLEKTKEIAVEEELSSILRKTQDETERISLELLVNKMQENGVKLILPLFQKGKPVGILFLGEKLSGNSYSKEDIELLDNISYQMSISLQNSLLYEEIKKDKEVLERFYKLTVGRELEGKDGNYR